MRNCYITKRDITLLQEKYNSVGGSWISLDTTYIYAGKVFKGDVVYKNGNYIRTLHNVSDLTNFTTNKNKWLSLVGKDAFGSYSAFKKENKLSDSDLFSNTFPTTMVEKFVPTRYSTKTSNLGGGIGDFISDHPIASIAIGAVAYQALNSSSSNSSSSYASSSYSSNSSSSNNNCTEIKKSCRANCKPMSGREGFWSNTYQRKCNDKCSDAYYSCKKGDMKGMRRNICKSQCVTKAGGSALDLQSSERTKCFRGCQ